MKFQAGPQGGGETQASSRDAAKARINRIGQRTAGALWIGVDGYLLYAFCYVVVWRHVRFQNRGAAIAILVIFCVLNFYAFISWIAVHSWGPGKVTQSYERQEDDPDAAFLCDEKGFSLYCSYCKHIKPSRTHHSSYSDTCVPVMDHFCPWVGNVIGQGNYKFFLQFSGAIFLGLLLVLITLFIYQHDQVPHINGNSIALYVVCGLIGAFVFILILQHTIYVLLSHTTIEHMGYRRNKAGPYINLLWRENERRVVQPTLKDVMMPRASPFDQGKWQNLVDVMGPIYTWVLPIRGKLREPRFNDKFISQMRDRIKE